MFLTSSNIIYNIPINIVLRLSQSRFQKTKMFQSSSQQQVIAKPVQQKDPSKIQFSPLIYFKSPKKEEYIETLYAAKDNLKVFSTAIGEYKFKGIRKDIIQRCSKVNKTYFKEIITYEKIQNMVSERMNKLIKNNNVKKTWSREDLLILLWIISQYADYKAIEDIEKELGLKDWKTIADMFPGADTLSCMFKWFTLKKSHISDSCWSEQQSCNLQNIVNEYGDEDWGLISQHLFFIGKEKNKSYRCPKQCREHWICFVNPSIKKGPWSKEQDFILVKNILENNGSKRWSMLSKLFNGRTPNAIKNRYNWIIKKQVKNSSLKGIEAQKQLNQLEIIHNYHQKLFVEQFFHSNLVSGTKQSSMNKVTQIKGLSTKISQSQEYCTKLRTRQSKNQKQFNQEIDQMGENDQMEKRDKNISTFASNDEAKLNQFEQCSLLYHLPLQLQSSSQFIKLSSNKDLFGQEELTQKTQDNPIQGLNFPTLFYSHNNKHLDQQFQDKHFYLHNNYSDYNQFIQGNHIQEQSQR